MLDGVQEFLKAARLLGLKSTAGFESRVFVPEYRGKVINSPHEPGVYYLAGIGFTRSPEQGSAGAATLQQMADCARRRNVLMAQKINAYLDPVTVDYEEDVLPLTPAGNATERHMLVAYEKRARDLYPDAEGLAEFWSGKLSDPVEKVRKLLDEDVPEFMNLVRSRLMKHGGVGYAPPDEGSFPLMDDVVAMTLECGAVPSGCWLDGTNDGEADPLKHFTFLRDKGIPTLTVIPDRNWDIKDPAERDLKVKNLHAALDAAVELKMPVMVGTEMNKYRAEVRGRLRRLGVGALQAALPGQRPPGLGPHAAEDDGRRGLHGRVGGRGVRTGPRPAQRLLHAPGPGAVSGSEGADGTHRPRAGRLRRRLSCRGRAVNLPAAPGTKEPRRWPTGPSGGTIHPSSPRTEAGCGVEAAGPHHHHT